MSTGARIQIVGVKVLVFRGNLVTPLVAREVGCVWVLVWRSFRVGHSHVVSVLWMVLSLLSCSRPSLVVSARVMCVLFSVRWSEPHAQVRTCVCCPDGDMGDILEQETCRTFGLCSSVTSHPGKRKKNENIEGALLHRDLPRRRRKRTRRDFEPQLAHAHEQFSDGTRV